MSNSVISHESLDSSVELEEQSRNYQRIAQAIDFIKTNYQSQPSLQEVAASVNLSADHFQRLFSQWAGVSPKKFIQYLSLEHAKKLLKEQHATLMQTSYELGLSGTARLYDLFINIESMTPGEYKQAAKNLSINYCFALTPFGEVIVAATAKGICHIAFIKDQKEGLKVLKNNYANAQLTLYLGEHQQLAIEFLNSIFSSSKSLKQPLSQVLKPTRSQEQSNKTKTLRLHLKASPFQLKVWQALLNIPLAELDTYGGVAGSIGKTGAARAVGSAIAKNPIAFIIPCHRVIQSSGKTGEYMWGATRKSAIIAWEAAKYSNKKEA